MVIRAIRRIRMDRKLYMPGDTLPEDMPVGEIKRLGDKGFLEVIKGSKEPEKKVQESTGVQSGKKSEAKKSSASQSKKDQKSKGEPKRQKDAQEIVPPGIDPDLVS